MRLPPSTSPAAKERERYATRRRYLHVTRQAATLIAEVTEGLDFDGFVANAMARHHLLADLDASLPVDASGLVPVLVRGDPDRLVAHR